MIKSYSVTILLFFAVFLFANGKTKSARFSVQILDGKKELYAVGDTIQINCIIRFSDVSCDKGVNKTRLFFKGFKLIKKEKWVEDGALSYAQKVLLVVKKSRKNKSKLILYRKTDQYEVSKTTEFPHVEG